MNLDTSLFTLCTQIKDMSGDVVAAELNRAARDCDEAQVARWGVLCASHSRIDERQAKRRRSKLTEASGESKDDSSGPTGAAQSVADAADADAAVQKGISKVMNLKIYSSKCAPPAPHATH